MLEPLKVAVALGIGDVSWSLTKIRALSRYHGDRPVEVHVNASPNHVSVGYLEIVANVAKAVQSKDAPYNVWTELPPNHRYPKWSTLKGCANWKEFDYVLVPNGHLERGEHLSTWLPELNEAMGADATEYHYKHKILKRDVAYASALADDQRRVLLYCSGVGPNQGFHNGTWRPEHWAEVATRLLAEGIRPLLVGANTKDDLMQREAVAKKLGAARSEVDDSVGKTNIPQYIALIEDAAVWIGLNSGGGIVAAMQDVPTVMLWSDSEFPIYGVDSRNVLHTNMKTSFLAPKQLETYRTLSFGSPQLTPKNVVARALEVMRT